MHGETVALSGARKLFGIINEDNAKSLAISYPSFLDCKGSTVKKPLVSFIIPVLNGEKDIARFLLSIQNQDCSREEYEVLIIDNDSTDRTHQIVRDLGFDIQVL